MDGSAPPPNPYEAPRASVDVDSDTDTRHDLASRWRRLGAAIVDGLLVGMTSIPGKLAAGAAVVQCGVNVGQPAFRPDDTSPPGVMSTALFVALLALQSFLIVTRGQSLGKRVLGIRIARMDGGLPTFLKGVVLRTWLPVFLTLVPLGSFLVIADVLFIFGRGKRCLHDLVAGTKVVEVDD